MEPQCRRITRTVVPAVRAYVAEVMSSECKYRQQEIADKLGIAQVAVSNYLNRKYSPEVARVKLIVAKQLSSSTVRGIVEKGSRDQISREIQTISESFIGA